MVITHIKKRDGRKYYYLQHSVREGKNIIKKEKYLGTSLPANLEQLKNEFLHEIYKERWLKNLSLIKKKFSEEYRRMPQSAKEKYMENFMIKFTYDTNRIEGSTLSLRETADLLEDGITPANKPIADVKEAEAHKKVFYAMLEHEKDLTLQPVLHWHKMLLEDTKPDIAGKIRKHQVGIARTKVELPTPVEVDPLLHDFFNWYNKEKKKLQPVELAALVHLKFVSIHPFADGNGRISRLMMNFVLHRNGFPMLNIHYGKRSTYYTALERTQTKKVDHVFVQYLIKRYLKEYQQYLKVKSTKKRSK